MKQVSRILLMAALLISIVGISPAFAQDAPPQLEQALEHLSEEVGQTVTEDNLGPWTWTEEVFNDTSLGCPQPDEAYSQVLTRGYQFDLTYQGQVYDYRVSSEGDIVILCSVSSALTPVATTPPSTPQPTPEPVTPLPTVSPATPIPTPQRESVSTLAEDEDMLEVDFEDVQFTVASDLASEVTGAVMPAVEPDLETPFFAVHPEYVEFQLTDYPVEFQGIEGVISVYPVADFETALPELVPAEIEMLETVIEDCDNVADEERLPFLPPGGTNQIFVAQAECLDFENGSGVRYITVFRQDVSPLVNQDLRYIYQGITDDGDYLLSVSLPISSTVLPDTIEEEFDYEGFAQNWETYLEDTVEQLQAQDTSDFTPDLADLDAMIQTVAIAAGDDGADEDALEGDNVGTEAEETRVSWEEAQDLILSGQVVSVAQAHSLEVWMQLEDGTTVITTEPGIDDVFAVIEECGTPCSNIAIATE